MARIDKGTEIIGCPVSGGWREQRNRLVPPRPVERIFRDRHDLEMREPEIRDIRDELRGKLAIGQIPAVFSQIAPPRTEMDLVDRNRRFAIIALPPFRHPLPVLP